MLGIALVWMNALLSTARVNRTLPAPVVAWGRAIGITAGSLLAYSTICLLLLRRTVTFDPGRRKVLQVAATAAAAVPVSLAAVGYLRRRNLTLREVDVPIAGLPKDLHGLRIAQITDIHLGAFLDRATVARAVGMVNELRPQLTLVTGDLISTKGDPLDDCIRELAGLHADSGIWGCLGNHEHYADAEDYTTREAGRVGIRFLRREAVPLRFGNATLNLAGVDYQLKGRPYLTSAGDLIEPGSFNLLLSHNPDVFPVSARQGWDLTVGGHTHGGQVTLEYLHPDLNVARFFTPYTYGLYARDGRKLFVSRGIGTIGVPARIGAAPEVVLLRLCAI